MLEGEKKERALEILAMSIEGKTIAEASRRYGISDVRGGQICQQIAHEILQRARAQGLKVPPHDYLSNAERMIYRDFWRDAIARDCAPAESSKATHDRAIGEE